MDASQIIYTFIGILFGLIIMWLIQKWKKIHSSSINSMCNNSVEAKTFESKISSLENEIYKSNNEVKNLTKKISEDKNKYEEIIEKAKKDIEDLEEKLYDAKDSLSDEKRKLNKKVEECDELEKENEAQFKSLKQQERKIEEIELEKQELKQELEDKRKEVKVKKDSLIFVQDVLTAPKVKDADVRALSELIDKLLIFIKGELRDSIIKIYDKVENEKFYNEDAEIWANTRKKTWLRNKTTIAFVGEFSAGKTSIVNRILSQDNPDIPKLPVSTKPTTAIPTYVTGGSVGSTQFAFLTPDNILKEISGKTFEIVTKDVLDQVKGVSSLIKYFVMKYKNDNLKKLSILDTPGFNSNDLEDSIRTIEVINECDALFWVFDVNNGIPNKSSIETIKNNLTKPLYMVINKVDSKSNTEVDKVEQCTKELLEKEGVLVKEYIRFSSKTPLENIMTPIKSIKKSENSEYIESLLANLNNSLKEVKLKKEDAKKTWVCKKQDVYDLQNKFNKIKSELCNDCEKIIKIPYYDEKKWFSYFQKSSFKINTEDKKEFDSLLEKIEKHHVKGLKKLFVDLEPLSEDAYNAYFSSTEKSNQYDTLERLNNKLNKIMFNLNQI